jgi:glycosyltransferase involved in cell wall biosynthesis
MDRIRLVRLAINVEQLLYPSPGGIGRYTSRLVTLLPELFDDDELTQFCARHSSAQIAAAAVAAGLPTGWSPVSLPLPRPVLYDAWHLADLPPLATSRRLAHLDVVHAPSLAVPPKGRYRLVVTIHDAASELHPASFTRRGHRFHRQGLAAASKRADLVIVPSHAAADEIIAFSTISTDRIRVVPHGVDAIPISPQEQKTELHALGLDDDPYVFWVGSLEPRKDVSTLVAAMVALSRRGRPVPKLVLAGYQGWLRQDLIDPRHRAALGGNLVELGVVPESTLRALYAGALLFALPSKHEGFGLPALEAMTYGAAVVCSDIPALREVTAGHALLVPPGDVPAWSEAIGGLLDDPEAREALAARGQQRATGFSWSQSVAATHQLYLEVMG